MLHCISVEGSLLLMAMESRGLFILDSEAGSWPEEIAYSNREKE